MMTEFNAAATDFDSFVQLFHCMAGASAMPSSSATRRPGSSFRPCWRCFRTASLPRVSSRAAAYRPPAIPSKSRSTAPPPCTMAGRWFCRSSSSSTTWMARRPWHASRSRVSRPAAASRAGPHHRGVRCRQRRLDHCGQLFQRAHAQLHVSGRPAWRRRAGRDGVRAGRTRRSGRDECGARHPDRGRPRPARRRHGGRRQLHGVSRQRAHRRAAPATTPSRSASGWSTRP